MADQVPRGGACPRTLAEASEEQTAEPWRFSKQEGDQRQPQPGQGWAGAYGDRKAPRGLRTGLGKGGVQKGLKWAWP